MTRDPSVYDATVTRVPTDEDPRIAVNDPNERPDSGGPRWFYVADLRPHVEIGDKVNVILDSHLVVLSIEKVDHP